MPFAGEAAPPRLEKRVDVESVSSWVGDFYGISMGFLWDFSGISMGFLWDLYGISIGSHGDRDESNKNGDVNGK